MRLTKEKKILIASAGGLVLLGGAAFATFAILEGSKDYLGAKMLTEDLLIAQSAIEAITKKDSKEESLKDFESAYDKCKQDLADLYSNSAKSDVRVAELEDKIERSFVKITTLYDLEKFYVDAANDNLSDDELKTYSENDNKFIAKFSKDLTDYRKSINDFKDKYPNFDDYNEEAYAKDYDVIRSKTDKMNEEYSHKTMTDMLGFEVEELREFYDNVQELDAYLAEKL